MSDPKTPVRFPYLGFFALLAVGTLVGLTFLLVGKTTRQKNLTGELNSADFAALPEKITRLKPYYVLPSPVTALEYSVSYHDNDWAPHDWDIKVIAKVEPGALSSWIGKRVEVHRPIDTSWAADFAYQNVALKMSGRPTIYQTSNDVCSFLAVDPKSSVVALLDTSMACVDLATNSRTSPEKS